MNENEKSPVFISYWTTGTKYKEEAEKLAESCQSAGVDYDVREVPNLGTWQKNTQFKPVFIKQMMGEYNGRPVVWVDADARIVEFPELLYTMDADVAVHYRNGNELLSGTVFLSGSLKSKQLLDKWIEITKASPTVWDQKTFQDAVEIQLRSGLKLNRLPPSYCQIFDLMADEGEPVIIHTQASRRLKGEAQGIRKKKFAIYKRGESGHAGEVVPMINIGMLRDACHGQDVVLVGNSSKLVDSPEDYGPFIDSHGVVVRFNRGINSEHYKSKLGRKTDIWVFNASVAPLQHQLDAINFFHPRCKFAVWISPAHRLEQYQSKVKWSLGDKAFRPSMGSYMKFCEEEGFHPNTPKEMENKCKNPIMKAKLCPAPSAGARTVDLFLSQIRSQKSLNLIGFDFFANKTWYNPSNYHSPHNQDKERDYIRRLAMAGKLVLWGI